MQEYWFFIMTLAIHIINQPTTNMLGWRRCATLRCNKQKKLIHEQILFILTLINISTFYLFKHCHGCPVCTVCQTILKNHSRFHTLISKGCPRAKAPLAESNPICRRLKILGCVWLTITIQSSEYEENKLNTSEG